MLFTNMNNFFLIMIRNLVNHQNFFKKIHKDFIKYFYPFSLFILNINK